MDNENNAVNENGNIEENENQKAFDDIMQSFHELTAMFNEAKNDVPAEKPATREEELRLRDEQRRKREIQAVREDIERRYSMHLEQAKNETGEEPQPPKKTFIEIPKAEDAVREEIERIDSLIDDGVIPNEKKEAIKQPENTGKKKGKKSRNRKQKEIEYFTETEGAYYYIYVFGDVIYKILSRIFGLIFGIILFPFKKINKAVSMATAGTKMRFRRYIKSTVAETVYFRKEIKSARKSIRRTLKNPSALSAVIFHYIGKALARHKNLLKTAGNVLLPVISLVLLIFTLNYWNSVTFALEVIYNEKSIGYISDESVYIEAKEMLKDRLTNTSTAELTTAESANINARYSLSLVSLDKLNDAGEISDRMIENSITNLTHACGIYIDDTFICAVKNESDAKAVFYDILEPYEADARANGYVIGFAENIDYVQGLYCDDESMIWDAAKLEGALNGTVERQYFYTASAGDTLDTISTGFEMSKEKILADNPGTDFDNIQDGDVISIRFAPKYVSIKKTVTSTEVRDLEYDTVQKRDATKYSGYRVVHQQGVNGVQRVTKTVTYIDGVLDGTDYSYETIVEPVDEIVTVGTKTTYAGVYIGTASKKGFLWPAPSCHYVSSPYGWRSSGWHNGIDLCRSGGGAYGTPVIASKSGVVETVQRSNSGYGNMVLINHGDGFKTRYAHMISGSILVSVGQSVEAGQTIGKVGSTGNSTGPHLHFEVIWQGETQNPKGYIS